MPFLRLRSASLLSLVALSGVVACGGDGDATTGPGPSAAGKTGATGGSAGAAGTKSGAGNGGAAGTSATAGTGGAAGAGAAGAGAGAGAAGTGGAGTAGVGAGAGAAGSNAGAAGAAQAGNAGTAGTGAAAGSTSAGAAGTGSSGAAGAGGAASTCADTCKAGTCLGETCCAVESVCGAVCCPGGDVCSFDKCITPGKACTESDECGANEFCDFSLGSVTGPGAGGAGGAGGAAGAGGAKGGAAGSAGIAGAGGTKGGAAGAAGAKGGAAGATGGAGGTVGAGVCQGGTAVPTGKCLPRPPACGPGEGGGPGPITCVQTCNFKPPTIPFQPAEVYSWGSDTSVPGTPTSIMMAPIVLQLDDDDCDGKVTERDIPDIVFATFSGSAYSSLGPLHVVSVDGGQLKEKWVVPNGAIAGRSVAGGNFDGKPGNEIVACTASGIVAYEGATGKLLWTGNQAAACAMPAIADLDQDGKPEIIVEGGIFRGADGTRKAVFEPALEGRFAVSDIDGDGLLDIVAGRNAYHGDGKRFATLPASAIPDDSYLGPAVADLDGDGVPEVLTASFNNHSLAVWHIDPVTNDPVVVRAPVDINTTLDTTRCPSGGVPRLRGGGPVTAGDFNNDGHPDVALAGGLGYVVLNGAALMDPTKTPAETLLWSKETQDCSSAQTGSSLFDFDGDGKAEVVYADELLLHVYDGTTGTDLFNTCSTNGTLFEYPLVADIDNDGHADLLLVSNAYSGFQCSDKTKRAGLRVFSDPRWVRTRRVWNQHAYSVTNVNEDGNIPAKEASNWKDPRLNNFRQNKQPGQEFSAPDLVVSLSYPRCSGAYGLVARVTNVGEASVPAGVTVGFYLGAPGGSTLLGKGTTDSVLYPAQSANVTLTIASPPAELLSGQTSFYAIVDDTNVPHPAWTECRTDNNVGKSGSGSCGKD